ncbi:MAG: hypothetical protein C0594_03760 [Marinilabiliales bacterium]|nr:MAG: hypothetical protein C0594_03760 [Marinilabiliales bacterium]
MQENSGKIIQISRGPQFRNGKGAGLFVLTLFILITSIALSIGNLVNYAIPGFVLAILLLSFIIDFQGIELDKKNNKIRNYRMFLWFRYGSWVSFDSYKSIQLEKDSYTTSIIDPFGFATRIGPASKTFTHRHYVITAINPESNEGLVIAEIRIYEQAVSFIEKTAKEFGLPYRNVYLEKLKAAKKRNQNR